LLIAVLTRELLKLIVPIKLTLWSSKGNVNPTIWSHSWECQRSGYVCDLLYIFKKCFSLY